MKEVEKKKPAAKTISIVPLKDHVIVQNDFKYELKQGVEIEIDVRFLETLKTEKILSEVTNVQ